VRSCEPVFQPHPRRALDYLFAACVGVTMPFCLSTGAELSRLHGGRPGGDPGCSDFPHAASAWAVRQPALTAAASGPARTHAVVVLVCVLAAGSTGRSSAASSRASASASRVAGSITAGRPPSHPGHASVRPGLVHRLVAWAVRAGARLRADGGRSSPMLATRDAVIVAASGRPSAGHCVQDQDGLFTSW
jgi:hypothetical protein